jgi:hypothetical protein
MCYLVRSWRMTVNLKKLMLSYDRRSVGQDFFFPSIECCVSWCGAPSLTRRLVCNILVNSFWILLEQLLSGPSSAELTAIFYCLIRNSPNLEGQVPVFMSSRNRVAQLYLRALGSLFVASYDSQGCGRGILTRPHTEPVNFDLAAT